MDSETAIQPIVIGEVNKTLELSEQLRSDGIWLTAIRPPTVPSGTARLRVTLSSEHSQQNIEKLLNSLNALSSKIEK